MTSIDKKISKLLELTDGFIFTEYYSHTNETMYKIDNPYTHFRKDTKVLCSINDGIEAALDLAIKEIGKEKQNF